MSRDEMLDEIERNLNNAWSNLSDVKEIVREMEDELYPGKKKPHSNNLH